MRAGPDGLRELDCGHVGIASSGLEIIESHHTEDPQRPGASIRRQAEEHGLTWPQAQARDGDTSLATTAHGVTGVPAFTFIGPDGKIIPSDEESVMAVLKELQKR